MNVIKLLQFCCVYCNDFIMSISPAVGSVKTMKPNLAKVF